MLDGIGRFNPMNPNGFTLYVMNSAETTDKIIDRFEDALADGMECADALGYAFQSVGVTPDDLTGTDIDRINRKIEALSESNRNGRY